MDPGIDLELDWNNAIASRGDDWDCDGTVNYSPAANDFFWDFNGNGVCDPNVGEPGYEPSKVYTTIKGYDTTIVLMVDTTITPTILGGGTAVKYDTTYSLKSDTTIHSVYDSTKFTYLIYADLNENGRWDASEFVDVNGNGKNDLPLAARGDLPATAKPYQYDFEWWRWDMVRKEAFPFTTNDYAVVVDASAPTVNGVANAKLTYPRQLAGKIYVTVNAEANGIRDKNGQRFALPVVQ
jgi:hypothetical protein